MHAPLHGGKRYSSHQHSHTERSAARSGGTSRRTTETRSFIADMLKLKFISNLQLENTCLTRQCRNSAEKITITCQRCWLQAQLLQEFSRLL
ncbi:uncharacterized protein V6R79_009030 [Siganus canaliculatus]